MGMFDAFLGKGGGDGYTRAQRTGLQRSAEIKKKRKEEEHAFERRQEASKSRAALTERGMIEAGETRRARMGEAGETRRAGMRVAGGLEQQRMSNVGQMARQTLVEEQKQEVATTKAIREADVKSMEYGRKKTLGEIGHGYAMEEIGAKSKNVLESLLEESPNIARTNLNGGKRKKRSAWSEWDY